MERDPFGLFYAWWRGDPLPDLSRSPELSIEPVDERDAPNVGIELDPDEVRSRVAAGHRLFLARIDGAIVGWGWSASSSAEIGELGIRIDLPPSNRYLWDFVTLPEWRGRGIYPHILQAILHQERDVERFWVGHDFGNVASGRGILRAGFHLVGELYEGDSGFYLVPVDYPERTPIAAQLLGVPAGERRS